MLTELGYYELTNWITQPAELSLSITLVRNKMSQQLLPWLVIFHQAQWLSRIILASTLVIVLVVKAHHANVAFGNPWFHKWI